MHTIVPLDLNWVGRRKTIASALLEFNRQHLLIDPGPASTVENLREQLGRHSLAVTDLRAILLTHIHLDHAGATGTLARENPKIAVYVHARGAPHMADPAVLLASARRLWGDDLTRLFGETLPVPDSNLHVLQGGETLTFGKHKLGVLYTPGHASHHVSYFDETNGVAFVGDTGGIRIEDGPFTMPATPPPDIDVALWDQSIAAILARHPTRLFLTHYSFAENPGEHFAGFSERLHHWEDLAAQSLRSAPNEPTAMDAFMTNVRAEIGDTLTEAEFEHYAFTAGLNLSFLGLARHLRKHKAFPPVQTPAP
jgi:glyoxylase-like metal-dependent hydrolase (beta-lactamase superfamily II)